MKAIIIVVVFLFTLSEESRSQQPTKLTLQRSIELAIRNNTSVIQAQNEIESAQSGVLAAYGNYLPTLSASGSWSRTQNERAAGNQVFGGQILPLPKSFIVTNYFSTRLDLSYTLFDGFSREAGFNRAKALAASAENSAARTRQSIRFQVESAYLDVLRKEQLVKVSEENLKRDRRQLERITESNRVGALSLADVYRQQSQVAADELSLITAQNDYDNANADLIALIGLDMTREYEFSDPTISTVIDQTELESTKEKFNDIGSLVQRALKARPDYIAAKENLNSAESGISAARSGYFPTVSVSAGYGFSDDDFAELTNNKNINWGVGIRWNLFDAFRTNQALQTAIVTKKNSEATLSQTERNIYVEIKKALLNLEAARKQVEVSQKGLLSAREDRKIAEERYNLGAGTLLDLLTANAGLVNAQANNINASYFYITAKRNLEYAVGERLY